MIESLNIPNIRHLRMVQMIGRLGGVTCASRQLNASQPAVTQAISNLEAELGAELFVRCATGTYATPAGRLFLRRVERFFAILEQAMATLQGTAEDAGLPVERLVTSTHLRALIVTSEPATVEETAARIGVSVATLGRSVRELERQIGQDLFIRTANGPICNRMGDYLSRQVRRAVREIEFARGELRVATGAGDLDIVVGALPMAGSKELAAAVSALLDRRPEARVQILTRDFHSLLNDLANCRIDMIFGLLRRPDWATEIEEKVLFQDSFCIATRPGHPLTRVPELSPEILAQWQWVVPAPGTPRREQIDRLFANVARKPRFGVETSSLAILRAMLCDSDMITVMTRSEIALDASKRVLASLPCRHLDPLPPKGLTTRSDWLPTESHREFVECLREATSTVPKGMTGRPRLEVAS